MPWRRFVRVVTTLLLLWTAADLISPSLCGLEVEARQTTASAALTEGFASGPAGPPPAVPRQIEDCFCCSHCVDVPPAAREPKATIGDLKHEPAPCPRKPRNVGDPHYHPPLA